MITFNLLPWRSFERRHQIKIMSLLVIGSLVLSFLLNYFAHGYLMQEMIFLQQAEKKSLENAFKKHLNEEQKENSLTKESLPAKALQQQKMLSHFFKHLDKFNNEAICFKTLAYNENKFSFAVDTFSLQDLTVFFKKWSAKLNFSEIKIEKMKQHFPWIQIDFVAQNK